MSVGTPRPRRRGPGTRTAIVVLVLLLLAAAGAMAAVWAREAPEEGGGAAEAPGATARVERTTLEERVALDGELGYGGGGSVVSAGEGVLTWMPESGAVIAPGSRLYEVDGDPVVLLRGDKPAFRVLAAGDEGEDVRRLEQALSELGYGGFTVDRAYTGLTAYAVKRWQRDAGLPQTGEVDPADVWFAPGPLRISGTEAAVGERTAPSSPVLSATSGDRVVRLPLEVGDRALVDEGDEVGVTLPGGEETTGEVLSVGSVAEEDGGEDEDGGGDPVVDVLIGLGEVPEGAFLDKGTAEVALVGDTAEDVLAVPVGALIPMPGDGYGVSAVGADGQVDDVAVTTGMFADGKVEVSGDGIEEGTEVVVPE
ncbi:peptidoglycan-binding protein [Nocardiopsis suaedae]|uniref:Peptidoglycan-binding protein n=1 Tax=Nocardiopsis suaedae TaxID=3018444 RepID=A0ABT4TFI6_9ACTN|nr:peptidoglycan-binding protein [Nocardiopsis suaedae]MDA2803463.1 peptidoglycan-binding protein [Nocardiopsis suaedae]